MTKLERFNTVLAQNLNDKKTLYGGTLLSEMDSVGGVCAMGFADSQVVTVGVNFMNFFVPLIENDMYVTSAMVSGVGTTSIEVYCQVHKVNFKMEKEVLVADGFYTFVPIKKIDLPALVITSEEDQLIVDGYQQRKQLVTKQKLGNA